MQDSSYPQKRWSKLHILRIAASNALTPPKNKPSLAHYILPIMISLAVVGLLTVIIWYGR